MKNKFLASTILAGVISLFALSGCVIQNARSVVSIKKTNTIGNTDYYTISYSDGTTEGFTIENGTDGADGESLTANDLYEEYKKQSGDEDLTFAEFCKLFLSIESDDSATSEQAVALAANSCLKVYSAFEEASGMQLYSGSATIYKMGTDYTYLLTNYHVVFDSDAVGGGSVSSDIYAYMYGSEGIPYTKDSTTGELIAAESDYKLSCTYIGGTISYDVAILQVNTADVLRINPSARAITISYEYSVGEEVFAVGNPDSEGLSATKGIVSVENEAVALEIDDTERTYRVLRTDADLDHGSSGGGLFNMKGEFIGMCNGGSESVTSINFALPATNVTAVADGILYYAFNGDNSKGTYRLLLGVTVLSENARYVYDESTGTGKIVEDVSVASAEEAGLEANPVAGKPAEEMGLQTDDIITAITVNGITHEINRSYNIGDVLLTVRSGDVVTITYERSGEEKTTSEFTVETGDLAVA